MPHRTLRALSMPVAAALYVGVVRAGAWGERTGVGPLARLPMAGYRGKPFRSLFLDTFDRLSAPVEHRYVWEELAPLRARLERVETLLGRVLQEAVSPAGSRARGQAQPSSSSRSSLIPK